MRLFLCVRILWGGAVNWLHCYSVLFETDQMQLHLVSATCPYKQFRSRCKNFLRYQLLVLERSHRNVRPACESQTGSFGSGSASLAWLALGSADCEARDCDRLAPPRFSTVLKCGCLGPFNPTCLRPRRKENHFATSSRLSTLQDQDIVALGVVDYSPFRSARTVRLGVNNSVFANCIRHG